MPVRLEQAKKTSSVVDAITGLCEVAGNQSRFLFDFAPESVVFRWTEDFAPRMLYGFEMDSEANLSFPSILKKVADGDIDASEMVIGGAIAATLDDEARKTLAGASINPGVKAAAQEIKRRISGDLGITGG